MRLNYLLVFIPIAFALRWFEANPVFVFVAAALSIIPLAGLMGRATECSGFLPRPDDWRATQCVAGKRAGDHHFDVGATQGTR
jgi:hypothetical protein